MDASRPCSAETRRRRRRRPRRTLAAAAILLAGAVAGTGLAAPAYAVAPPRTASFSADDYCLGQCADILPPGANGSATLAEILSNQAFGSQPAHADDTRDLYANLALGYPGLTDETIDRFFADASFDVAPADVETVVTPRSDVTITRDKRTGVPHIRGTTRYGTEYGAGWAAAQDRLWLMDVLRHVGRGELTEFRRRGGGQPRAGAAVLQGGAVHRGRPPEPDRPRGRGWRSARHAGAGRRPGVPRRGQRLHHAGPREPQLPG